MRKGRIKRNLLGIVVGIIFAGLSFFQWKLTPHSLNNFPDIMSASLSFSALATALFFSCFSLIPAFSNSKFILALQGLGTDRKIMDRLLVTTIIFFIVALLSFLSLFFSYTDISIVSRIVVSLWVAFVTAGFISTFQVLFVIMIGFNHYTKDMEK